jgi:hypothetical protein
MKFVLPGFLANLNPFVAGGALLLLGAAMVSRGRGDVTAREVRLSQASGLPVAVLRAISRAEVGKGGARVELTPQKAAKGRGKGDVRGSAKRMRFEPHIFLRATSANPRDRSAANLRTSRFWGQVPYAPGSSKKPNTQVDYHRANTSWDAFMRATQLAPKEAMGATSWGRFQVMGSNFLKELYGNSSSAFRGAWVGADLNKVADMSDQYLIEWLKKPWNKRVKQLALQGRMKEFGIAYNGSQQYGDKLAVHYKRAVAEGAPTSAA